MERRRCTWSVPPSPDLIPSVPNPRHPGDKSNHIATLHLAQMLYIWPFFAFFSAPLLLPSLVKALSALIRRPTPSLLTTLHTLLTTVISLLVVRFNTLIHPFTLADNRHYMFYIFRYTILRPPAVRYALVPAYTACRWLVWDALAGYSSSPSPAAAAADVTVGSKTKTKTPPAAPASPASTSPPPTSTAIFWLLATTLSLVTAPLVEPRYFILPWVFWRLLVPAWDPAADRAISGSAWLRKLAGCGADPRLVLETVWFVAVNAGTMYMFLFKPFYWRGADGELLDGGRVQRFMW
jgi:alpha-1,2-glucosyltransferase